jgi:DNA invertase Pin-like site-specific DNA recombinase
MGCKLVGLVRVSTDKQGESGLGLEAQQAAIDAYRRQTGCDLIRTYVEVESGGHDDVEDRPQLLKAIAHARRANATLVIAKIDRLLRSTIAHNALKTAKIRFVACDNPEANELTIDILVAVAANERRQISARTKAALAAAKARGIKLGKPENLDDEAKAKGRALGVEAVQKRADKFATDLGPIVAELRGEGKSLQEIADHLNGLEYKTPRGKAWAPMQVARVLQRAGV